jgi:hypothetical protein
LRLLLQLLLRLRPTSVLELLGWILLGRAWLVPRRA